MPGALYQLTHPIGPCPNGGLTIAAGGITLDLKGFTIRGCTPASTEPQCDSTDANGDHIGVRVHGASGVTVTSSSAGGTVKDFDTGVAISPLVTTNVLTGFVTVVASNGNIVEKLTVRDNIGNHEALLLDMGEGIAVAGNNNIIRGNTVQNNGPFGGIRVLSPQSGTTPNNTSNGNRIGAECNASAATAAAEANIVENNNRDYNSAGTEQGIGIGMEPRTTNTIVGHNTVKGSGLDGITVFAFSTGNTICHNKVEDNGLGNFGTFRDGDGIRVFGTTDANKGTATITNNKVCGNAASGIRVDWSGSVIGGSSATGNTAGTGTGCSANPNPVNSGGVGTGYDLHEPGAPPCKSTWSDNTEGTSNASCVT